MLLIVNTGDCRQHWFVFLNHHIHFYSIALTKLPSNEYGHSSIIKIVDVHFIDLKKKNKTHPHPTLIKRLLSPMQVKIKFAYAFSLLLTYPAVPHSSTCEPFQCFHHACLLLIFFTLQIKCSSKTSLSFKF